MSSYKTSKDLPLRLKELAEDVAEVQTKDFAAGFAAGLAAALDESKEVAAAFHAAPVPVSADPSVAASVAALNESEEIAAAAAFSALFTPVPLPASAGPSAASSVAAPVDAPVEGKKQKKHPTSIERALKRCEGISPLTLHIPRHNVDRILILEHENKELAAGNTELSDEEVKKQITKNKNEIWLRNRVKDGRTSPALAGDMWDQVVLGMSAEEADKKARGL